MPRPPDPVKRRALLDACFAAAMVDGRLDLSLASLAERTGVSARMLVYHFGGRDRLQLALAERLEAELRDRLSVLAPGAAVPGARAAHRGAQALTAVLALWDEMARPRMRGLLRLTLGVMVAPSRSASLRALARREGAAWRDALTPLTGDADRAAALSILVLGAALDLVATGDAQRGRRAIAAFFRATSTGTTRTSSSAKGNCCGSRPRG